MLGGVVGNLISKNSTGTLVGAGGGFLIGQGISKLADRNVGLRLTVDTEHGAMLVDTPYSCKLGVGKQVRLISGTSKGTVMVRNSSGKYETVTSEKVSACPDLLKQLKVEN